MIIRISTIRFEGAGMIDCRRCNHRTRFPNDATVIIFNYDPGVQVAVSATDLSTLHRCGNDYYWVCPKCGDEGEARMRKGVLFARCRRCAVDLEQKVRPLPVVSG